MKTYEYKIMKSIYILTKNNPVTYINIKHYNVPKKMNGNTFERCLNSLVQQYTGCFVKDSFHVKYVRYSLTDDGVRLFKDLKKVMKNDSGR